MRPELQHGRHLMIVAQYVEAVFAEACGIHGHRVKVALGQLLAELSVVGAAGAGVAELAQSHPLRKVALAVLEVAGQVEAVDGGHVRLVAPALERLQVGSVRATVPAEVVN